MREQVSARLKEGQDQPITVVLRLTSIIVFLEPNILTRSSQRHPIGENLTVGAERA